MNNLRITVILSALLLIGGFYTLPSFAQTHVHSSSHFSIQHPVFQSIDEALLKGEITKDQAILQKFYAGYRPDQLIESFQVASNTHIKCLTPVIQEYIQLRESLQASTISEVEELTARSYSSDQQEYLSPSGNFRFYYETTGSNAVPSDDTNQSGIPDYIEKAAFAADSSYRYMVEEAGFTDFRLANPYEINFQNFGFYGTTNSSGGTTTITVHNNFDGFPENSHPEGDQIGALYATIAHEVKHAIQYAANRWRGSAGSFNWIEMDATLMEEMVFDDVNDYYNYNSSSSSIFSRPELPIPGAYFHVSWMIYFAENYGVDFWVDVWKPIKEDNYLSFLDAISSALTDRGLSLPEQHTLNHLWHLGSGDLSVDDFGFSERTFYPTPKTAATFEKVPDSLESSRTLLPLAANYIVVDSPHGTNGQATLKVAASSPNLGIGQLALFKDGSTDFRVDFTTAESDTVQFYTGWNWEDIDRLSIAAVNSSRNSSTSYQLYLESSFPASVDSSELANEFRLAQNYPNPFNPSTTIRFDLFDTSPVSLQIFDISGRLVETIVDRELTPARYEYSFSSTGLASGVYLYRLKTSGRQEIRKMTIIK